MSWNRAAILSSSGLRSWVNTSWQSGWVWRLAGLGKRWMFWSSLMGVFVHRVGVEHVELHLADDEIPLGQVGREDPVLVHERERLADAVGVAQQRHEEAAALGQVLQPAAQGAPGLAQLAQGGGVDAGDLRVLGYLVEEPQDGGGSRPNSSGIHRIDEATAQLELVADAAHVHGGVAEDRLVKQLQQHLVELGHPPHRLVEALHHLLDRAVAFPSKPSIWATVRWRSNSRRLSPC